jgi:hypothetical protein
MRSKTDRQIAIILGRIFRFIKDNPDRVIEQIGSLQLLPKSKKKPLVKIVWDHKKKRLIGIFVSSRCFGELCRELGFKRLKLLRSMDKKRMLTSSPSRIVRHTTFGEKLVWTYCLRRKAKMVNNIFSQLCFSESRFAKKLSQSKIA